MSAGNSKTTAHRLHVGGKQVKDGWKILNVQPGEGVDYIGNVANLTQFDDEFYDEVYASHVIEHLGYQEELLSALKEIHRILKSDGVFRMSVPNLEMLCRWFLSDAIDDKGKFKIMRMMFGGQIDEHDFHKVGLNWKFVRSYLGRAGFKKFRQVQEFNIFDDASSLKIGNKLISLNVEAIK